MLTRKIGFLLFENFTAMDIVGPMEAFASVSEVSEFEYQLVFIGRRVGPVKAESGMSMLAEVTLDDVAELDTLIIPGGKGSRDDIVQSEMKQWLLALHQSSRRLVSVCTGSFLLASTGLLNGLQATTHWASVDLFRRLHPEVKLLPDALYVDNGSIATSAGIASGIDLSLKLIEDDLGAEVAAKVARFLVVHYRRAGNQAQYSEPLQFQQKADQKFANLSAWILNHLNHTLTVEILADQVGMSTRNFCRKFKQQMGTTPARYVELMRLDYARQLLVEKDWQIAQLVRACGYSNADIFRRAFERRFGISPKMYRARFAARASSEFVSL